MHSESANGREKMAGSSGKLGQSRNHAPGVNQTDCGGPKLKLNAPVRRTELAFLHFSARGMCCFSRAKVERSTGEKGVFEMMVQLNDLTKMIIRA